MTTIKAIWENKEGEPIPEWLQGRGTGVAGKSLVIWTGKKVKSIKPGKTVHLLEDVTGKRYIGVK